MAEPQPVCPSHSSPDSTGLGSERYLQLFERLMPLIEGRQPAEIALRACELIAELLEVEATSLMLADEAGVELRMAAATHIPPDKWRRITQPIAQGLAGQVLAEGRPLLVSGREAFVRQFGREPSERYPIPACIIVPLSVRGRAGGVINVTNPVGRRQLLARDVDLLAAAARLIGGALSSALLHQEAIRLHAGLEEILDGIKVGALAIDDAERVVHINRHARHLLELCADAGPTPELERALPSPLLRACRRLLERGAEGPVSEKINATLRGSAALVRLTVSPIAGIQEDLGRRLVVIEDISEQAEIARLREAETAKHSFLAIVSHELRTPLTVIRGALPMIDPTRHPEVKKEALACMHQVLARNCQRLNDVITSILDVTEIENDTLRLARGPLALNPLIEQIIERQREPACSRRVDFQVSLAPDLPELEGDTRRIQQVLGELIFNAVKFSDAGQTIQIASRLSPPWVEVEVTNVGAVIEEAAREEIFNKFHQRNASSTRTAGGCGLGLYLARHLLRLHGGQLQLAECCDKRTTFVARLPLRLPEEARARMDDPQAAHN